MVQFCIFEYTDNIGNSIGQGPYLLIDGEEEVSVDSNIRGKEVVFYSLSVARL